MEYVESIKFLESFWKFGIKLGLERINFLLNELGNPHKDFRSIHVAGTNGKGSICAMLTAILKEAGFKVGTYTSPHIIEYTERIKIDGKDMSFEEFASSLQEIMPAIEKCADKLESPTEFEILTALCFYVFAKHKIDIAVVEVGLGGRFDATNVLTPLVSVIAEISKDHVDILGNNIEAIAEEKCGVIKIGVPVVAFDLNRDATEVINEVVQKNNASLTLISNNSISDQSFIYDKSNLYLPHGQVFTYKNKQYYLPILGICQPLNAAIAIAVAKVINKFGYKISEDNIRNGLEGIRLPGRFELYSSNPIIFMDGAHNISAARILAKNLKDIKKGKKLNVIIGMLSTKDAEEFIREMAHVADMFVVTKSKHRMALDPLYLIAEVKKYNIPYEIAQSVAQAKELLGTNMMHCVTGSFTTVGEFIATK